MNPHLDFPDDPAIAALFSVEVPLTFFTPDTLPLPSGSNLPTRSKGRFLPQPVAYMPGDAYADLNALVVLYRTGDSAAGQELLIRFEPLLKKYRNSLWNGRYPTYDNDIGRFLSFFNRNKQMAVELLSKSLRKDEAEDLDQLLAYCLLKTARSYNKVSAGFKFVLKEELTKLTKDVVNHRTTMTVDLSQEGSWAWKENGRQGLGDHLSASTHEDTETEAQKFVTEGSDIPGLDVLSEEERRIAKLVFLDDFDRKDVAAHLGITERQLRRKIGNLRAKARSARKTAV
jgi:hypothetical protein